MKTKDDLTKDSQRVLWHLQNNDAVVILIHPENPIAILENAEGRRHVPMLCFQGLIQARTIEVSQVLSWVTIYKLTEAGRTLAATITPADFEPSAQEKRNDENR